MNRKVLYALVFGGAMLTTTACKTEPAGEEKVEVQEETCTYTYNEDETVLEWTAFKFTERAGVGGSFNNYSVTGLSESNDPKEMIESLGFVIETNTVETNDPGRNEKIAKYFFETINTSEITGKVVNLNESGKADVEITMNGISKIVTGDYKLDDVHFSFSSMIDVVDWNGADGITALNEQCIDNHTGTDGVLKLWSEVDIKFTTKLNKTCATE